MRFIIFGNTYNPEKSVCVTKLFDVLENHNQGYIIEKDFYNFLCKEVGLSIDSKHIMESGTLAGDIAISIGGDGTFLRTAGATVYNNIPVLGINTGRMGFLTDVEPSTITSAIEELLNGNYHIEERTMLELLVNGKATENCPLALNEIAVMKTDISSMISIKVWVNGQFLNNFQCDGLIVATSTGSTAYSLSVGGPIIMPQSKSIVLNPVAPHSLSIRPIVFCDSWEISMEINSRNHQYLVAIDGNSRALNEGNKLTVRRSSQSAKIIKLNNHSLFENLRSKLMLGADNRNEQRQ